MNIVEPHKHNLNALMNGVKNSYMKIDPAARAVLKTAAFQGAEGCILTMIFGALVQRGNTPDECLGYFDEPTTKLHFVGCEQHIVNDIITAMKSRHVEHLAVLRLKTMVRISLEIAGLA